MQCSNVRNTTPSLHGHYPASTLLRVVPPLCPASVHATYMPDAMSAVNRYPRHLSRAISQSPVLTSSNSFRHFLSGSLAFVSSALN